MISDIFVLYVIVVLLSLGVIGLGWQVNELHRRIDALAQEADAFSSELERRLNWLEGGVDA